MSPKPIPNSEELWRRPELLGERSGGAWVFAVSFSTPFYNLCSLY